MIPQRFAEANTVMRAPKGMEDECSDIHAYRDGTYVLTAWRPPPEELVKINLGEPVYLTVVGKTMPPVAVSANRPFVDVESGKD